MFAIKKNFLGIALVLPIAVGCGSQKDLLQGDREPASEKYKDNHERLSDGQINEDAAASSGPGYGEAPIIVASDQAEESVFLDPAQKPLSTFSTDVDNAAYTRVRTVLLENSAWPDRDTVRIEEMINYFKYDYTAPAAEHPLAVHTGVMALPWDAEGQLLRVGLSAQDVAPEERKPTNLVFLIDTSGSMSASNKLPLVKEGFKAMLKELRPEDRVAIVTYASSTGVVLASTNDKAQALAAIENLNSGGSTNGEAGIDLAYAQARVGFIEGGINRVLLATDGDFNVGISDTETLTALVKEQAQSGVELSVLAVGMYGNDEMLESITNDGNGNYYYLDNRAEAVRVLVGGLTGALQTVAKDAKLQIEFNPAVVQSYRLIGYDNRRLDDVDFNDDRKDAGDVGAGHQVTAFYEIKMWPDDHTRPVSLVQLPDGVDPLVYVTEEGLTEAAKTKVEIATVKVRYKQPEADESILMTVPAANEIQAEPSADFKFGAAVAGFGLYLRQVSDRPELSPEIIRELATPRVQQTNADPELAEFLRMLDAAESLADSVKP